MFYTATYTDPKDEEFALGLGAERFIVKPQEPEVFLRMMEEVLSEHKAGRLTAPCDPQHDDVSYFREYNEALIRKLEAKMVQTEEARRRLETEVAGHMRAVEALRLANERFRRLVESNIIGIVIVNPAGNVIEANDYYLRMIGCSREDLAQGKVDWRSITPAEWAPADENAIREMRERGSCPPYEKEYIRRDGVRVSALIAGVMLPGPGEEIAAFALDLSERKRLTEQFQQSQKMESVGTLAGGIAHDFNNVLTVILGFGEMLKLRVGNDPKAASDLDEILRGAERASVLTRQLLTFARRQIIDPANLDLNEVVTGLGKLLRKGTREDIEIKTSLADRLPTIRADRGQMEQVLMNLSINARDAMPGGGRLILETQEASLDEEYVRQFPYMKTGRYAVLSVSDTGMGMDEETRKRIFEPFFTTKEPDKGTGLGLAVVYGIVKQHDGFIHVYSEPGGGATFRIYFPAVNAPADAKILAPQGIIHGGKETILLAEDDEAIRNLTEMILISYGYKVLAARDGEEAAEIFRRQGKEIAMAVLDVVMPKKGGKQAYDEMVKTAPGLKVLFLSGYSADAIHESFVLHPGIPFLQKPFGPGVLARRVREVLDKA